MWIKSIRSKNKTLKILIDWITWAEVKTKEKPNILKTDGGGKYMGNNFQEWLKAKEIHH